MQYQDKDGNKIIVPRGKGYKHNGATYPVNTWSDEQRAEVGLFPVPIPEPIPQTMEDRRQQMVVTNWQFCKAVNQTGNRGKVNQLINTNADAKDAWDKASSFERLHPMVIDFAAALGLTETDLDDLFILAETL